jgi:3-oxoacyl-[acyl-carrier protein] reductase
MIEIDLSGKVALITGASQGIGAAIAQTLHRAGASVAINYFPDAAGLNAENAARVAGGLGERTEVFPGDVRDPKSTGVLCAGVHGRFGSLDLLINNAGIARDRTIAKMGDDEWHSVLDTNLTGVFNVCRAAGPLLPEGGRIVNISSLSGVIGLFGQANYAAAKAGVIGLTKTLSREFAKRSITVNAVAPGLVLTELGKTVPAAIQEQWLSQIPLARFGKPEEISNAILFLCSDLASYMTGQTLHVNGGHYV